jgi:hypothetical protein
MLVRSIYLGSFVLFMSLGMWSVNFLLVYAGWLHILCFGISCIASVVSALGIITHEEGDEDE